MRFCDNKVKKKEAGKHLPEDFIKFIFTFDKWIEPMLIHKIIVIFVLSGKQDHNFIIGKQNVSTGLDVATCWVTDWCDWIWFTGN